MRPGKEYIVRFGDIVAPDGSVPFEKVCELVRCKDCKHRPYKKEKDGRVYIFEPEDENGIDYTCPYTSGEYYSEIPNDNSFCDRGEQKKEEII